MLPSIVERKIPIPMLSSTHHLREVSVEGCMMLCADPGCVHTFQKKG